jgi:hypothetical protein
MRWLEEAGYTSLRDLSKMEFTNIIVLGSIPSGSNICSIRDLNRAENLCLNSSKGVKGGSHPTTVSDVYVEMGGLTYRDAQA